jgi:hypothetical protein
MKEPLVGGCGDSSSRVMSRDAIVLAHRQSCSASGSQIHLRRRRLFWSCRSMSPRPPLCFGLVT